MREGWDVARGAKSVNNQMVMEMCVCGGGGGGTYIHSVCGTAVTLALYSSSHCLFIICYFYTPPGREKKKLSWIFSCISREILQTI